MFDYKIILILIVVSLFILIFWKNIKVEKFYVEAESEDYPQDYPLYPHFDKYGRHILPYKYLDYAPYWQPSDQKPQLVGPDNIRDAFDEDVIDRRHFW